MCCKERGEIKAGKEGEKEGNVKEKERENE